MRAVDKDLEEFQAARGGEVKPFAGEEGQGPGWEPEDLLLITGIGNFLERVQGARLAAWKM